MSAKAEKILVVDDEPFIRMALGEALSDWGYAPITASSISQAGELFDSEEPVMALLDIDLPDGSGLDLLKTIKTAKPETVVIMVTGNVDVSNTLAALRGGAHDFIGKPIRLEELQVTVRNALETHSLRREARVTAKHRSERFSFDQIVGDSSPMVKAKELALKVAESDVSSILLQGETGTGKDLFARALHYSSDRYTAPYLAINCAALPATLIESELFGYEKGAFTDAKQRKEGLFEQAQGGTIFLDEIGEMALEVQSKLLRVLENGLFRRVGGLKDLPLDARIIAASNQDLKKCGEEGTFRLDLYFRLSVIQIDIPPLKERGEDILQLAHYFIERTNLKRRGAKLKGLSQEVQEIFRRYEWTGNVRELRNVIERASILEDSDVITTKFLPADLLDGRHTSSGAAHGIDLPSGGVTLDDVEAELARQAVDRTGGNLTRAAKLLGISRDQLRYKLRKSGDYHPGTKDE